MATQLIGYLHKIEQLGTLDGHRGLELEIYTPTRAVDETKFCLHRAITSWRIHVIAPETLPRISCIRSLRIQNGTALEYDDISNPSFPKPDLRMLFDFAAQLPILQVLNCNVGGDEFVKGLSMEEARYSLQDWPGPRRDSRHNFAKAMQLVQLPASLFNVLGGSFQ